MVSTNVSIMIYIMHCLYDVRNIFKSKFVSTFKFNNLIDFIS